MPIDTELEKLIINKGLTKEQFEQAFAEGSISDNDFSFVDDENTLITIDAEMSDTSENAVQNKIVKSYIDNNINNKVNKNEADYVVETYENGDDWYRVYKSGWVEQGGQTVPSTSWKGIVLLKQMANSHYSVMVTNCGDDATRYAVKAGAPAKNTTTTVYVTAGNASTGVFWQVKGQGA